MSFTRSESTAPRRVRPLTVLAVACAACLAACTGLVYDRLDTLTYWYFSSRVDLAEGQSAQLRSALNELFAWHRSSELPRYATFLETLAADSLEPLSRERIDRARTEVEALWSDFATRAAPSGAAWLASLDASQLEAFFAAFAKDDAKSREEFCDADPSRQCREREKSFIRSVESWTGRLSEVQRELVREGLGGMSPNACAWVDNRVQYRAAFRQLIEEGAQAPDFPQRIAQFLAEPASQWTPAYREQFERNRDTIVDVLARLDAALTADQRRRRADRMREFARDFRRLAASGAVAKSS
jgi:hypothetical protein